MKAQPRLDPDLILFVVDDTVYYSKPIEGWPEYHATTCGHIISTKGKTPAVLAKRVNDEYCYVTLSDRKYKKQYRVHRLIAAAFLECPDVDAKGRERLQVNHIDSDPSNNKVANLEWTSHAENMNHAWMMKRIREAGEIQSDQRKRRATRA
jgi:hypothetical protein